MRAMLGQCQLGRHSRSPDCVCERAEPRPPRAAPPKAVTASAAPRDHQKRHRLPVPAVAQPVDARRDCSGHIRRRFIPFGESQERFGEAYLSEVLAEAVVDEQRVVSAEVEPSILVASGCRFLLAWRAWAARREASWERWRVGQLPWRGSSVGRAGAPPPPTKAAARRWGNRLKSRWRPRAQPGRREWLPRGRRPTAVALIAFGRS